MAKRQRVRDPLHDLIEFGGDTFGQALWRVVCSRPFQRLRRIKQLAFSELVYPGATHSRFSHSLGVYHTARLLMQKIRDHLGDDFNDVKERHAIAAALVHDLGHGPFSHAFEKVGERFGWEMAKHTNLSVALIKDGEIGKIFHDTYGPGFCENVADKVMGPNDIYGAVVSSQFDADRLDYMRRDGLMAGSQQSTIDFRWLIDNIEVGKVPSSTDDTLADDVETFVLGRKAVFAAEAYVLALFQLYPTVYYHKATRSAEILCQELLTAVFNHVIEQTPDICSVTGLPVHHSLLKFASDPNNVERFLELDDAVVWGSLEMMGNGQDEFISATARRLLDRRLFKAIDVIRILEARANEKIQEKSLKETDKEAFVERRRASVKVRMQDFLDENPEYTRRILVDEGERNPYSKFDEGKGPLNQIMIRVEGKENDLDDLERHSEVVRAIKPFRFFRLYHDGQDQDVKDRIQGIIREEAG